MNKVLVIGRLVKNVEIHTTNSGIKYTRFTVAVPRPFGNNETDFIPILAWRNQAEFVFNYLGKGSLVGIEGRFTSSSFQNAQDQSTIWYEVVADRVQALETKRQVEIRKTNQTSGPKMTFDNSHPQEDLSVSGTNSFSDQAKQPLTQSSSLTQDSNLAEVETPKANNNNDMPWDLDL